MTRRTGLLVTSAALSGCVVLGGCAASPHSGRAQLNVPGPVSAAYSEVNMRMTLITVRDAPTGADGTGSSAPDAFEQRVARIGAELARIAFELYPELRERFEKFEFIVADKAEAGAVSNSSGSVVILRPVRMLAPADAALAFVAAREMAHVIANHHEENTAASLMVTGIAYILFPVAGLAKAVGSLLLPGAAAAGAGATSTVTANASATAASLVGSRVLVLTYKPRQQEEADAIALRLLGRLGHGAPAVATGFSKDDLKSQANEWARDLQASLDRLPPSADRIEESAPRAQN